MISVIGCGNMGSAIIKGMVSSGFLKRKDIGLFDIQRKKATRLAKKLRIQSYSSLKDACEHSNFILLAIKPQQFYSFALDAADVINAGTVIISIMAGIRKSAIKKHLKHSAKIVRVMPNLPSLINEGVTAISFDSKLTAKEKTVIQKIFQSIGSSVEVSESKLDIVTAISGSGPAYLFYLAQAMIEAARKGGLSSRLAEALVIDTLRGSSGILKAHGKSPTALIQQVTSKRGTTEAALLQFNKQKVGYGLKQGIAAAKKRSIELSR